MKFLKNLRLFKFEDIITMVSRSGGGATPPSVMALLLNVLLNAGHQICEGCYYFLCKKQVFAKVKVFIGFGESLLP